MHKVGLPVKVLDSNQSKRFRHFEYIDCKLDVKGNPVNLSVVYRPPPSKKNGLKNSVFFKEWSLYLERHATSQSETLLLGDLNFHLDVSDDSDSKRFTGILDSLGLDSEATRS